MRGVYVAASSGEIERAEKWMKALRDAGIVVQSTWPEVIRKSGGVANPMSATREQRREWSFTDLAEVKKAEILWLLCPNVPTIGAYVELGFACGSSEAANPRTLIASGIEPRTIFTSICGYYETDELAFDAILQFT
jgi:hypothetical protein